MKEYSTINFSKRERYVEAFVSYSRFGDRFRQTTGVKVLHKHILSSGKISTAHPTYHRDILIIRWYREWLENTIVAFNAKNNEKPSAIWIRQEYEKSGIEVLVAQKVAKFEENGGVEEFIAEPSNDISKVERSLINKDPNKSTLDIFRHWGDFIHHKKQKVRNDKTIFSYNHMVRTMGLFVSKSGKKRVTFSELDQQFFNDFLFYLVKEHEYVRTNNKKNPDSVEIPEVGLANGTAIKQLDCLVEYLKFCRKHREVPISIDDVLDFIANAKHKLEVRKVSDSKKWELTLTPHELQFVTNLDQLEPEFYDSLLKSWKRFLDIFIFMCLQGTSPIDTKEIKRTDVMRGMLVGERSKTGVDFKVELDPISEIILKRYNYDLRFTEQSMNEALKKMFATIFEFYRPRFEEEFGEPYEMIYRQRKFKGSEEIVIVMHKALFVEGSTGRRSFITNVNERADELGMRKNMKRAGHTRIQTHLGYQHDRQTGRLDKPSSLFGVSKILPVVQIEGHSSSDITPDEKDGGEAGKT